MIFLFGSEEAEAKRYIELAAKIALNSSCAQSKCGTVIVKDKEIIGRGFNSPPAEKESQRRCSMNKNELHPKVGDKSCCVHAEQRAIMDALIKNPEKIKDSTLYFVRLDLENKILKAGKPYCTHCSKLALDSGIKEFVLWHEDGICVYNTEEYNDISFKYTD